MELAQHSMSWEEKLSDPTLTPLFVPLHFLKEITFDFDKKQVLGTGGYGEVYKGVLRNGNIIAVKKLYEIHLIDDIHFAKEVSYLHNLMKIKHQNIVQLVGYCAETRHQLLELTPGKHILAELPTRLLCFEYLCNGSLDAHVSDENSGLDWFQRYEIIRGIISGLQFLHDECDIVHLDLKPQNILMDAAMMPKIADFGLSKLLGATKSRTIVSTGSRAGSLGYMAPEYLIEGAATRKADIFSLGVIMVQIITGHQTYPGRLVSFLPHLEEPSLQKFTEEVIGRWSKIFQRESKCTLSSRKNIQQVEQCITIALKCLDFDPRRRPHAREIIHMVEALEQVTSDMQLNQVLISEDLPSDSTNETMCQWNQVLVESEEGLLAEHESGPNVGKGSPPSASSKTNSVSSADREPEDTTMEVTEEVILEPKGKDLSQEPDTSTGKELAYGNMTQEKAAEVVEKKKSRAGYMESCAVQVTSIESSSVESLMESRATMVNMEQISACSSSAPKPTHTNEDPEDKTNEISGNQKREFLSAQPQQLCFQWNRKQSKSSCSLYLTNNMEYDVAFRVRTQYLEEDFLEPLCGLVPPNSKYSIQITMCKKPNGPFILESTKAFDQFLLDIKSPDCGHHYNLFFMKTKMEGKEEVQQVQLSAVTQEVQQSTVTHEISGNQKREFLSAQPQQLCFQWNPKQSKSSCSLYLTNNMEFDVAFRVRTQYLEEDFLEPLCGLVPPNSKYIIQITMRKKPNGPFILESTKAFDQFLPDIKSPDYGHHYNLFFIKTKMEGKEEVQQVQLSAVTQEVKQSTVTHEISRNQKREFLSAQPQQLFFQWNRKQSKSSCSLYLTNNMEYDVAFRVRTEYLEEDFLEPLCGLVPPNSKYIIQITTCKKPNGPFILESTKAFDQFLPDIKSPDYGHHYNLFFMKNKMEGKEEVQQVQLSAVTQEVQQSSATHEINSGLRMEFLSAEPHRLCFHWKPKWSMGSCSLQLTSNVEYHVAFRIRTEHVVEDFLEGLCGLVPPRSRYTINIIMLKKPNGPFILESTKACDENMLGNQPSEYAHLYNLFFVKAKGMGQEVQQVKLTTATQEVKHSAITLERGNRIVALKYPFGVASIAVRPTKTWIITHHFDGSIHIWDYHTQETVNSLELKALGQYFPVSTAIFIERKQWLVSGKSNGDMKVFSFAEMKEVQSFKAHNSRMISLDIHPTEPYVLSASEDLTIKLWNWENGWNCARTFYAQPNTYHVKFSPKDANYFASASWKAVQVWNIASSQCEFTLSPLHKSFIECVDFFIWDDRLRMIIGHRNGSATIWDCDARACVKVLRGHTEVITSVCYHSDRTVLITGSRDRTVRIWNSSTFELEGILDSGLGMVNAVACFKGSNRIVIGLQKGVAIHVI